MGERPWSESFGEVAFSFRAITTHIDGVLEQLLSDVVGISVVGP